MYQAKGSRYKYGKYSVSEGIHWKLLLTRSEYNKEVKQQLNIEKKQYSELKVFGCWCELLREGSKCIMYSTASFNAGLLLKL